MKHARIATGQPVALLIAALLFALVPSTAAAKQASGDEVRTMTRNLYLGADLGQALAAKSIGKFTHVAGQILREVTANDFPTRSKGLAKEILKKKPDLVGLQEVALWRTGPPSLEPLASSTGPTASTVRYDFLQLLLKRLNSGQKRYRVAISQQEADIEAPADENGVPGDGPNGVIKDAEINGRLTMHDVILVRVGAGITFKRPRSGHFTHLLVVKVSGVELPVTRGWASIDAKVRGSRAFRFVDTHLEAFDPSSEVPSIRAQQAAELVAAGGPATTKLPVILVGDLNSDDDTVESGDQQAYRTLLKAGMRERSTAKPLGCCLDSSLLAVGAGGSVANFDHQVDHVMTRDPKEVKLLSSAVTGRQPVNGFWNSDHAGLFSALRFAH